MIKPNRDMWIVVGLSADGRELERRTVNRDRVERAQELMLKTANSCDVVDGTSKGRMWDGQKRSR